MKTDVQFANVTGVETGVRILTFRVYNILTKQ